MPDTEETKELLNDDELMGILKKGVIQGHTMCYSMGIWSPEGTVYTMATAASEPRNTNWLRTIDNLQNDGLRVISVHRLGTIKDLLLSIGAISEVS